MKETVQDYIRRLIAEVKQDHGNNALENLAWDEFSLNIIEPAEVAANKIDQLEREIRKLKAKQP